MSRFAVDPDKIAELEDRWSDVSPDAGTEECICAVCARMIGACDADPRWEDHDEDCLDDCDLHEIPVRMWRELNGVTWELRFHPKCFERMVS
jgi:hypothetical protein